MNQETCIKLIKLKGNNMNKPGQLFNKLQKKKKTTPSMPTSASLPMGGGIASSMSAPMRSPMMASSTPAMGSSTPMMKPGAMFNAQVPQTTSPMAQNPMGSMMSGMKPGTLFNASQQVGQGQIGQGQTAGLLEDAGKLVSGAWDWIATKIYDVYHGMEDAAVAVMNEYVKARNALKGPDYAQSSWVNPFAETKAQHDAREASDESNKQQEDAYLAAQRKLEKEYAAKATEARNNVWNTTAPTIQQGMNSNGTANFSLFAETEGVPSPSSISPAPNEPGHYIGNNGRKYRGMRVMAPLPGMGNIMLYDEGPTSPSDSSWTDRTSSGGDLYAPGTLPSPKQVIDIMNNSTIDKVPEVIDYITGANRSTPENNMGPFGQPPKRKSVKMKRKSTKAKKKFLGFGSKKASTPKIASAPKQFRNNLRATKQMIDSL